MSMHATLSQLAPQHTPQSEPLAGQIANSAGGYAWPVDDWTRLDRFLILGTEGGSYYASERKLTVDNAECVKRCLAADGPRTVQRIAEISSAGRAAKNDPALYALALAFAHGDAETRTWAAGQLKYIARTGTHLLHLASYVNDLRGWGRGVRRAFAQWYALKSDASVAYQITKYQQRDGWSHRDVLRLCHVKPTTDVQSFVLGYACGKRDEFVDPKWPMEAPNYLAACIAVQRLKDDPVRAAEIVTAFKLPREVVPSELLVHPKTWEALLPHMGLTALVRNLAVMTRNGTIGPIGVPQAIRDAFVDAENVKASRIHPLQVLMALFVYRAGRSPQRRDSAGRFAGTSEPWTPNGAIIGLLDDLFYASFENVKPTGKRIMCAVDVSGSMENGAVAGVPGLTPALAAAALAMVTVRTEPNHVVTAFDTHIAKIPVHHRMSLSEAMAAIRLHGGGTDCSLPFRVAAREKLDLDGFLLLTDSETWAGSTHPSVALAAYRRQVQHRVKLVNIAMVANNVTSGDPSDADAVNVVGFDDAVPNLITECLR